jgi:hypothetical protein
MCSDQVKAAWVSRQTYFALVKLHSRFIFNLSVTKGIVRRQVKFN